MSHGGWPRALAAVHGFSTRGIDDLVQAMGGAAQGSGGEAAGMVAEGARASPRAKMEMQLANYELLQVAHSLNQ